MAEYPPTRTARREVPPGPAPSLRADLAGLALSDRERRRVILQSLRSSVSQTQTKPDPSQRPPTNNQAPCSIGTRLLRNHSADSEESTEWRRANTESCRKVKVLAKPYPEEKRANLRRSDANHQTGETSSTRLVRRLRTVSTATPGRLRVQSV
jgi:hypothetical protein